VVVVGFASAPLTRGEAQVDAGWLDTASTSRASLARLRAADPGADARAALRRGDARYWALAGFGPSIPGLPDSAPAPRAEALRVMPGSGCAVLYLSMENLDGTVSVDSTQEHWQRAAREYAAAYNAVIWQSASR